MQFVNYWNAFLPINVFSAVPVEATYVQVRLDHGHDSSRGWRYRPGRGRVRVDLETGGRDLEARLLDLEQRSYRTRDLGWSIVVLGAA